MYLLDHPQAESRFAPGHPCYECPARAQAVCSALDDHQVVAFRRLGCTRELAAGETLCWDGDAATHVYSMTHGVLRLSKLLPDGRRHVMGFAFPGDFVGVTLEDRHAFTAEAIGDAALCQFPRSRFEAFVEQHPRMGRRLYAAAAAELVAARSRLMLLGRKTAAERMASFILEMARRTAQAVAGEPRASLPMSRMDIADYLGLRVETVSRELAGLKAARLVRMTGIHELIVTDPDGLAALAAD